MTSEILTFADIVAWTWLALSLFGQMFVWRAQSVLERPRSTKSGANGVWEVIDERAEAEGITTEQARLKTLARLRSGKGCLHMLLCAAWLVARWVA